MCFFVQKTSNYLRISKKSSTFARFFRRKGENAKAQVAELVDALVSNTNGKPCRFDPGPGYSSEWTALTEFDQQIEALRHSSSQNKTSCY